LLSLNISILSEWSWWSNLRSLHPHSGWFFVSHASRAQLAKAVKKRLTQGQPFLSIPFNFGADP
ncbi:hypothetical protein KB559_09600, partial [Paenibacillus sp. Marseille-P2973]|uniref:hypothetical protein n=1 Tax=Paenibacillus sp. Marseille-P2973 TaxID=1871032 RepID=UPI001B3670EB